ncbi:uncharacterized protein [Antedon mediterranea]|uniref:uncharacterized protein n=1 Tax=Antedon mediterranea TaxID=105859 RepID=UPI003AF88792
MASEEKTTRIMMWSTPRCVSTAIERSILTLKEAEVFNEMYSAAFHFGPSSSHFPMNYLPLSPGFSYEFVKSELEEEYPGKSVLFGKDFAYALRGNMSLLPSGFIHTFLIRNPREVVVSNDSIIKNSLFLNLTGYSMDKQFDGMILFKEMWDLYVYARDTLHQNPIVIDADDFLKDPEAMMKLYCDKTGIPFRKTMLTWRPTNVWRINWHSSYALSLAGWLLGYYGKSLTSTGFQQVKKPKRKLDLNSIGDKSLKAIDDNMKYYESLYDNRLVLQ